MRHEQVNAWNTRCDLGKAMKDVGIAGDVGLATGYILRFSNGLLVYLSGDAETAAREAGVPCR